MQLHADTIVSMRTLSAHRYVSEVVLKKGIPKIVENLLCFLYLPIINVG